MVGCCRMPNLLIMLEQMAKWRQRHKQHTQHYYTCAAMAITMARLLRLSNVERRRKKKQRVNCHRYFRSRRRSANKCVFGGWCRYRAICERRAGSVTSADWSRIARTGHIKEWPISCAKNAAAQFYDAKAMFLRARWNWKRIDSKQRRIAKW